MKASDNLNDVVNSVKYSIQEALGFSAYHVLPKRNVVCLVSSMRAGSTLLKALIGQAEDVSHLPEYDFSILNSFSKNRAYYILVKSIVEKHIVLKRPRWFEDEDYPAAPPLDCQFIVLFRDAQEVVNSLMKRWPNLTKEQAIDYWCETYSSILERLKYLPQNKVCYTSYQDLLEDPKQTTARLFKFMGSKQTTGVSEYAFPNSGKWEWGKDDGSQNIFTMSVQNSNKERHTQPDTDSFGAHATAVQKLNEQYDRLIQQSRTLF